MSNWLIAELLGGYFVIGREIINLLAIKILTEFPDSEFAEWWKENNE